MKLVPISVVCPQCGSAEIYYSCTPSCCYNHVCNHCYTTFELETTRAGDIAEDFVLPADPESGSPTAPCARCHEPKVFAVAASAPQQYVCAACKALLTLDYAEIAPAQTSPSS
jgi:transposase-like protein